MSPSALIVLLVAVALAAAGQVMLKHGMNQVSGLVKVDGRSLATAAAVNLWVLSGLLVFGLSALAWLLTLSRVPLNVAYPFNALGYLGILATSVLVLHERANVWTLVGSSMVVCGLIVVVTMSPTSIR
jgi:multidrug transporter EmrE-like cation transporter